MKQTLLICLAAVLCGFSYAADRENVKLFKAKDYGIAPDKIFTVSDVERLLADVRNAETKHKTIVFEPGVYNIEAQHCQKREWYISNHDQWNPRKVFLPLENQQDLTVEGNGAFFNLRGRILPVAVWDSERVSVKNITSDYEIPMITQVTFTAVDHNAKTVTFRPIEGSKPEMQGTRLTFKGYDFHNTPMFGIVFEPDGRIVYRSGDCWFNVGNVTDNKDGTYTAANNGNGVFKAGQKMALRTGERPAPGFVVSGSKDVLLEGITVHYSDGMGVLCQNTHNIELNGVKIIPNKAKGRVVSLQADATHFSGCSGLIKSCNGVYQGMLDDAINVHGTYLNIEKRVDEKTIEGRYMHGQSFGFEWGKPGEEVIFIKSREMAMMEDSKNIIAEIKPVDKQTVAGAKVFRITFEKPLPSYVDPAVTKCGVENLTRTPEVIFSNNLVMDNRARGALFSTPKRVVCTNNTFDHISGSGILLCGDCMGWYETGACTDVLIANNTFINNLTSLFQFTEAVVSICPEIHDLKDSSPYFHRNVTIRNNIFVAFDNPLVYAKSVDGLVIKDNSFVKTETFPAYHNNKEWLTLRHCRNVDAEEPRGWNKKTK